MKRSFILILLASAMLTSARAQEEDLSSSSPLQISVSSPSYGFFRKNKPVVSVVTVTNSAGAVEGLIEAWIGDRDKAFVSGQKIAIGNGRFRFFLYPLPSQEGPEKLHVTLRDTEGRVLAASWSMVSSPDKQWWAAVVPRHNQKFSRSSLESIDAAVLPIRDMSTLPNQWYGYQMFDALLWDTQQMSSLMPDQQKAIEEWISTGGRLILIARKEDRSFHSPIPQIVPGIRNLSSSELIGTAQETKRFSSMGFTRKPGTDFSEKEFGLGSIIILHLDYTTLPLWGKSEVIRLFGFESSSVLNEERRFDPDQYDVMNVTVRLHAELASAAGYESVSFTPILIMMICYILFVSVVDLVVLRKARKLPYTWVTFPIIIGVFSAISFVVFYRGKLGSDMWHELLYEDIGPDGRGRICSATCVRKPSRKNFSFSVPDNQFLRPLSAISPEIYSYYGYRRSDDERRTLIRESRGLDETKLIDIPGNMGAFKFFSRESAVENGAPLFSCNFRRSGNRLQGTFSKSDKIPKSFSGFVLFQDSIYELNKNSMTLSRAGASIFHLRDTSRWSPYRSYQSRHGPRRDMRTGLETWARESIDTAFTSSLLYYSGRLPSLWHQDEAIFRHSRFRDTAIIYAFYEESSITASPPYRRIRCVRQVVRVKEEGNSQND